MSELKWTKKAWQFWVANGASERYTISINDNDKYWWRYGRNLGVFGSEETLEEAKTAAQKHSQDVREVTK